MIKLWFKVESEVIYYHDLRKGSGHRNALQALSLYQQLLILNEKEGQSV